MMVELHRLRKNSSINAINIEKLKAHVAKLKSDIEIRDIQLKNSQDDSTSYKSQCDSLQSYIRNVSFIKE